MLGALRAHLESAFDYTFPPRRRISGATDGALIDTRGSAMEADIAVIAIGADFDHLSGTEHVGAKVRRVRLQMMETAKWDPRLTTSVADVDTMRYYPAYSVIDRALLATEGGPGRGPPPPTACGPAGRRCADHWRHPARLCRALLTSRSVKPLLTNSCRAAEGSWAHRCRRCATVGGIYGECLDGDVCVRAELAERVWLVGAPVVVA